ncbi:stAR-related lipid transfer protein 9 isoform X1 [Amblyraja radiata]|uniref:stAR-related lipid transfer protein 9 isoform X1 n=1 Tax=Amblyraja radiata TaxID=386614 RepID=UPI00140278CD|nr:stAR-related lipid transfer protein 9 isoform X1 [Amblyraja radiata]
MANVKVAVRVRPLSKRECAEGSSIIVKVDDKIASIRNVRLDPRVDSPGDSRQRNMEFSFDYCYWSVDSDSANFAPQELVYQDLGTSVLSGAIEGYNVCLFAYGQTGSGKTYTMMGTPAAIGLTPRICEGLFSRVDDYQEKPASCSIEVSFLEIYNERVRDLLKRCDGNKPYTLRVREHPEKGPYVEGLSQHLVSDYKQLVQLLEEGIANRITAATHVHDASSRSHAIFTIHYTQATLENNLPSEIVSKINLVDLAGSERADPNYSKDRMTEGSNINKSLVTLGIVISTLAQNSQISSSCQSINTVISEGDSGSHSSASSGNCRRQYYVPYRDSVLTWLLKDSLGGNSKTIMIATISPASTSYTETISTLRYAAHAKNILNKPHVNEDANVKLIRELREEINRLKTMLMSFGLRNLSPLSDENDEKDGNLTDLLLQNELKVDQLTKDWTDRWKDTKAIMEEYYVDINRGKTGVIVASQLPHLIAVDEDILSTGVSLYYLREGITKIGRIDAEAEQDIVLQGPWVEKEHCTVHNDNGIVTLAPIGGSHCIVNEMDVIHSCRLSQGAVIGLGKVHKFRFNHPTEAAKLKQRRASSNVSLASSGSCEWLELDGEFNFSPPYVLSPLMQASLEDDREKDEDMEISETRRQLRELQQGCQSKQQEYEEYKQKLRGLEIFYQEQIRQQQCYIEELRQRIQATQSTAEQELTDDQEQLKLRIEENKQHLANEENRLVCLEQQRQELGTQTDSASFAECGVQICLQMEEIPLIEQDRKRLMQLELLQRLSLRKAERSIRKKRVKYQLERIAEKHKLLEAKTKLRHLEAASLLSRKQCGQSTVGKASTLQSGVNPKLTRWSKSFPPSSLPTRRRSLSIPSLTRRHSDSSDRVSHMYPQYAPFYSDFLKTKSLATSTQMKKIHRKAQKSLSVGSLPKMAFPMTRKQALKGGSKIISPVWNQLQQKCKGAEHEDVRAVKPLIKNSPGQSKTIEIGSDQPEVQVSIVFETTMRRSEWMACSGDGQRISDKMLELTDEDVKKDVSWKCALESTGNSSSPTTVCNRTPAKQLFRTKSFCTVNGGQHPIQGASMVDLAQHWENVPLLCNARKWNSVEILNANVTAVSDDSPRDWLGEEEPSDNDSLYSVDSLSAAYAKAITEQLQKEETEEQQSKQQANCCESDDSEMSQDSLAGSPDAFQGSAHCVGAPLSHIKTSSHTLASRGKSVSVDSLTDMGEAGVLFAMDSPGLTASDEMPAERYWNLPWNEVDEKETSQNNEVLIEEKDSVGALRLNEQSFNLGSNTKLKVMTLDNNTHLENLKPNRNDMDPLIMATAWSFCESSSKTNVETVSSDASVLAVSSVETDCYGKAGTELMKASEASQIPPVFNCDLFQPNVVYNLHMPTVPATCRENHTPRAENNQGMLDREEDSAQTQEIFLSPCATVGETVQNSPRADHNMAYVTGVLSTAEMNTKHLLTSISAGISNSSDSVYSAQHSSSLMESEEFILSSTCSSTTCLKPKTFSTNADIAMKGADSELEVTERQCKVTEPERSCRLSQHNQLRDSDYHKNDQIHGSASEMKAAKLNTSCNFEKKSFSETEQFISPGEELHCHRQSNNETESYRVTKPLLQQLDPIMLEKYATNVEKDPGTQGISSNDRWSSFTRENNDLDNNLSVETEILGPLTQNLTRSVLGSVLQGNGCDSVHSVSMKNGMSQTEESSSEHEAGKHFVMWQHPVAGCTATKGSEGYPFTKFIMEQQSVAQTNILMNDDKYTSTDAFMYSQMDSETKFSELRTLDAYLCMKDSTVCSKDAQLRTSEPQVQSVISDETEDFVLKDQTTENALSAILNNPDIEDCLNNESTLFFGGSQEQKGILPREKGNILNVPVSGQNAASCVSKQPAEGAVESGIWNRFHQDSNMLANSNKHTNKLNFSDASVSRGHLLQTFIKKTEQIKKQGESGFEILLCSNTQRSPVTKNIVHRMELVNPQVTGLGFQTEIDRSTPNKEQGIDQNNIATELRLQEPNRSAERFIDDNASCPVSFPCGFEDSGTISVGKDNASPAKSIKIKNNAPPGGISKIDPGLPLGLIEKSLTVESDEGTSKIASSLSEEFLASSVTVRSIGFYRESKKCEVTIEEHTGCDGPSKNAAQPISCGRGEMLDGDVECDRKETACAELIERDNVAYDCPEQNKSNENSVVSGGAVQVPNNSGATDVQRTFVQIRRFNLAEMDAYTGTTNGDLADLAVSGLQDIRSTCRAGIRNEQNEMIVPHCAHSEKLGNDPAGDGRAVEKYTEAEGQQISEDFTAPKYCAKQSCIKNIIKENDCTVGRTAAERSRVADCVGTESSSIADASRVLFQNETNDTRGEAEQAKQENSREAQTFLMENRDYQTLHLEVVQSIQTDSHQTQSKSGYESHQKRELIQKSNPDREIEGKMGNTLKHHIIETLDLNNLLFKVVDCSADGRENTETVSASPREVVTNINKFVEAMNENYDDVKDSAKSKNVQETRGGAEQSGCLSLIHNDGRTEVTSQAGERSITCVRTDNKSKPNHSHQMPPLRSGDDTKITDKIMDIHVAKPQLNKDIPCEEKMQSFSRTETGHSRNPCKISGTCTLVNQEILNCQVSQGTAQRSELKHIDVRAQSQHLQQKGATGAGDKFEHETEEHSSSKIHKSVKSMNSNDEEHNLTSEELMVVKRSETFQKVEKFDSILCQEITDQCEASLAAALWDKADHSLGGQEHLQVAGIEKCGTMDSGASPGNGTPGGAGADCNVNNVTCSQHFERFPLKSHGLSTKAILQPELADSRAITDGCVCSKGNVLLQHSEQSSSQPTAQTYNKAAYQPSKHAVEGEGTNSGVVAPQSCLGPEVTGGDRHVYQPTSSTEECSTPAGWDDAQPNQGIVLKEVIGKCVMWCHPDGMHASDATDFQAQQQTTKWFANSNQAMFSPQPLRQTGTEKLVHAKQKPPAKNTTCTCENITNSDTVDAMTFLNICKEPIILHDQNAGNLAAGFNIDPLSLIFKGALETDDTAVKQNAPTAGNLLPWSQVLQNQTEFHKGSLQGWGGNLVSEKSQAAPGSCTHQREELDVSKYPSSRAVSLKDEDKQSPNKQSFHVHKATSETSSIHDDSKAAIVPSLARLSSLESRVDVELLNTHPVTKKQVLDQHGHQPFVQQQPASTAGPPASNPRKAEIKCLDVQFSNGDLINTSILQSSMRSYGRHKQAELHCRREEDNSVCLTERDPVGSELTDYCPNLCAMSEGPLAIHSVKYGEKSMVAEFMALSQTISCIENYNDKGILDSKNEDLIRKVGSAFKDCEEVQAMMKKERSNFKEVSSAADSHDKDQGLLTDVNEESKSNFGTKTHKDRCIMLTPCVHENLEQEKPVLLQHSQDYKTPEPELRTEPILQKKDLNNACITLEVTKTDNKMCSQLDDPLVTQADCSGLSADVYERDADSFVECKQIAGLGSQSHESNKCTVTDGTCHSADSSVISDSCHSACSGWSSVTQVNELDPEEAGSSASSELFDGSDTRCATQMMGGSKKKSHKLKRVKPKPNVDETKDSSSSGEEIDIEFLSLNKLRNRHCRRGLNKSLLNVCRCNDSMNIDHVNAGNCLLSFKTETRASLLRQKFTAPVLQVSSSSVNLVMEDSSEHCLNPVLIAKPSDGLTPRAASCETMYQAKDVDIKHDESEQRCWHRIVGESVSRGADSHGAACTETYNSPVTLLCNQGQIIQSDKQLNDDCTSLTIDNGLYNVPEGKLKAQELSEKELNFSEENHPLHFTNIHQQCNRSGGACWMQCTLGNASSVRWVQPAVSLNNVRCPSDNNVESSHCNSHYCANVRTMCSTLNNMDESREGGLATMYPESEDLDGDSCAMPCSPPMAPSFSQVSQFPSSNSEVGNIRLQVDETSFLHPRDVESCVKSFSNAPAQLSHNKETQTSDEMRPQKLSRLQRDHIQTPTQSDMGQRFQPRMEKISVHRSKFCHNTAEQVGNSHTNKDHTDADLPTNKNTSKLGAVRMVDGYTQTAIDAATQTEIIDKYSHEIQSQEVQRPPEVNVIVKVIGSDVNVSHERTNLTLVLQEQKQNGSAPDIHAHHTALSQSVCCSSPSENDNPSFRTSSPALPTSQKLIAGSSHIVLSSPGLSPITASSQISTHSDQAQGTSIGTLESTSECSKVETIDPIHSEDRDVKQFAQDLEAEVSTNVTPAVLVDRASSPIKTVEAGLGNYRSRSKSVLCPQGEGAFAVQCIGYGRKKPRPASWFGFNEKQQSKICFTEIKPVAEQILEINNKGPKVHSNEWSKSTTQSLKKSFKLINKTDLQRDLHTEVSPVGTAAAESSKGHCVNISSVAGYYDWQSAKESTGHVFKESPTCTEGIGPHLAFQKVRALCTSNPGGRRQMNAFTFQPSCQSNPLASLPPAQINDKTVWPSRRIFHRSPSAPSSQHDPLSKDGVNFKGKKASKLYSQIRCDSMNHDISERGTSIMSKVTNECSIEDARSMISSECNTDLLLNEFPSITSCNSSQASDSRIQAVSCRGPEDLPWHNKFQNWSGVHYHPPSVASLMSTVTGSSHRQTEQEQKQGGSDMTETTGLKPGDCEGRRKEIESLRQERAQILLGLNLELNQHQLTVELAEAKLNYGLGETDALLRILQSGTAEDQNVCIRQQLYDRHMKTIKLLRQERDVKMQKFRRTRSLSPQKHFALHHQKHPAALNHEQDLPSKRRTYLQRLRQDMVENTRTRAVAKAPLETPSEIESLLRDYQKAREETKAEIAKARDKLRARAEKEKCRLQQEMILQLLKEQERMRKLANRSSLRTGSNLSLSSNPTSGYSSSTTASPDINPQTKQSKSRADPGMASNRCTACGNSQFKDTEVTQHASCPLALSIAGKITSSCHHSSTFLKKYQDLAILTVASLTAEITSASVNHPGHHLTGEAAAGWRYNGMEKDVLMFYKRYLSSTKHGFMGVGVIEKPLDTVWRLVKDNSKRQLYDEALKTVKIHQQLGHGIELVYLVIDTCRLNQPRDFCCISVEAKKNKQYILAMQSIYEESMPRPVKEMVRGEMLPSGWILQHDNHNGKEITRLIYLTQVDLGAPALPPNLLESLAKQQPLCIANLTCLLSC